MLNRQTRRLGQVVLLLTACGGKVVFVGPDDAEPSDTAPSDGGASSDNGFCAIFCATEQDPCTEERNTNSCFDWCRERQTDAGKCSGEWELQMECGQTDCAECPYPQALPICVFGCPVAPDCEEGTNQTTCRATCASDFEWTCTAGLPSTCTCAFNGEVIDTCTYDYEPTVAGCCEAVFAGSHL